MKIPPHLFWLLPVLCLSACERSGDRPENDREEGRVRREVEQRVGAIRTEMKTNEVRWHTIRAVSFCLLAGGSLLLLAGGGSGATTHRGRPPESREPRLNKRVIDHLQDDDDEPEIHPYRR